VDSVSISGHKMVGCPFPCGVVVARKANVNRIARRVEYIGSLDTTLAGSRNALAPLFLWYALRTVGVGGFRDRVRRCFDVADHAVSRLEALGLHPWRHPQSITVVFDRPRPAIVKSWQLAVQNDIAHVITMPHVTPALVDRLADDIARPE
jgi:histidine decarboxylase